MTDEMMIKALECCFSRTYKCCENRDCPYFYKTETYSQCRKQLEKDVVDLINRQNAEIDILIRKKETLRDEICAAHEEVDKWKNKYLDMWCEPDSDIHKIKAEAIKKFAERLKAVSHPYMDTQMVFVLQIDNLVAEMTGKGGDTE